MGKSIIPAILTLLFVSALLAKGGIADTYAHCPDHSYACLYTGFKGAYSCSDVTGPVCSDGHVSLSGSYNQFTQHRVLISEWNDSVPFFGDISADDVIIGDAVITVKFNAKENDDRDCDVVFRYYDCAGGGINTYEFEAEEGINTETIDVTGEIAECETSYNISIMPKGCDIDVESLMLSADYELHFPPGSLAASLTTGLPVDGTTGMHESFSAASSVQCSGGDCGNIKIGLQYGVPGTGVFSDIPFVEDPGTPFYAIPTSPFECGALEAGDVCHRTWSVSATQTGTYALRALAQSDNPEVPDAQSVHHEINVIAGSLSLDNVHFEPGTIESGGTATLMADLSCLDHYCGNVEAYAKHGASKITDNGIFTIYDENPQLIDNMYPGNVALSWDIRVDEPGSYDIYAAATGDIASSAYGHPSPLIVTEPAVGYLSLTGSALSPQSISEGESALLHGEVKCANGPCGHVLAHALREGADIPSDGVLSTLLNPIDCGFMEEGSSYPVSWDIKASTEGEYSNIRIMAQSTDSYGTPDAESQPFTLSVSKALGAMIVSAAINPAQIELGGSTQVSGSLACSGGYCGEDIAAYLRYSDGAIVGTEGNLSTGSPNPLYCQSLPCSLEWQVSGNAMGLYEMKVGVQSDEVSNQTDTMALYVKDPVTPQLPSLYISPVGKATAMEGTPFDVSASVFCYEAECGETEVYIQLYDGSQWVNVTPWTPINTNVNAMSSFLDSGQSELFTWSMNSSSHGIFEMRAAASSNLADSVYMPFTAEIYPPDTPDVIEISIISPEGSETFSRGDDFLLEIKVTENYQPRANLIPPPSASFSGSLYSTIQLDDAGGGIYRSLIEVPDWAEGVYEITFHSGDAHEPVGIMIDPSLDIRFSTDKAAYAITDPVVITGSVMKKGKPSQSSVGLGLVCQKGWRFDSQYSIGTDPQGNFRDDFILPAYMPSGECELRVYATDASSNSGSASRDIYVSNEKNVYDVSFSSPSPERTYTVGDDVFVVMNVLMEGTPVEGADVMCTDSHGNFNRGLDSSGPGEYSGTFKAERKLDGGTWNIICRAKTDDGSLGSGSVGIRIIPLLEITVISPEDDFPEFEKGDTIHFMVLVSYSDGGYMDRGNVTLLIANDTLMLGHIMSGTYEGHYTIESEGELSVAFLARDAEGNTKYHEMVLESLSIPYINWLGVVSTLSGIIILWLLWFLNKTRQGKTIIRTVTKTVIKGPDRKSRIEDRIRDLEKEKSAIEKAKENAEMEYYRRNLTESDFRKMMEEYEQDLLKKNAEIEEFRKELRSPANTNK